MMTFVLTGFLYNLMIKFIRLINYNGTKLVVMKPSRYADPSLIEYNKFGSTHSVKNGSYYTVSVKTGGIPTNEVRGYFHFLNEVDLLTYYHFDWIPFNPWEKDPTWGTNNFNLFNGYKAKPVPKNQINNELFNPILEHIRDVWASTNETQFHYVLSWLSHLVRNPRKWLPMITLVGEEGTGKTCVIDYLFRYVFGENSCL